MSALETIRKYVLAGALGLAVISMTVIGLMMLTITYDVIVRFTFSAPTDWAFPLNAAGVLISTSLAIPYLYAKAQHISMDLVHRALPAGMRRASDAVTAAATAFLGLVMTVTAFRSMVVAVKGGLTGSGTFSIPLWIPDAALFLTGVLLVLVAVLFPPGGREEPVDSHTDTEAPTPETTVSRGERGSAETGEGEPNS